MAKIKFNLNFGGEQIRTLDDLRDNFSIEDVLDVYRNGLLVKWLDVHNHKHELEQVNAIHATDARGILSELIRIFGISNDPEEIEESLSVLDYLEERKKAHEDMKAHGITDHEKLKKERDELARQVEELKELLEAKTPEAEIHEEAPKPAKKSYDELVQEIIDNHLDLNHIYDCLDAITTDYPDILREKHSELFETLHTQRPLTLYALFAHHGTRPYFALHNDEIKADYSEGEVKFYYPTKPEYKYILELERMGFPSLGLPSVFNWNIESILSYDGDGYEEDFDIVLAVRKKLHFSNILNCISLKTFIAYRSDKDADFIDLNHPYLKKFKGIEVHNYDRTIDMTWRIVEPTDKRLMVFYCYGSFVSSHLNDSAGFVADTHKHNMVKGLRRGLELICPIFNGIDVRTEQITTQKYGTVFKCDPFWYMEAR